MTRLEQFVAATPTYRCRSSVRVLKFASTPGSSDVFAAVFVYDNAEVAALKSNIDFPRSVHGRRIPTCDKQGGCSPRSRTGRSAKFLPGNRRGADTS